MKAFYKIVDGYPETGTGIDVLDGYTEYTVGQEPQELKDAIETQVQEQLDAEAKQAKQTLLDNITVTTASGKVFDGREKDVPLMSGAIQSAEVLGLTDHSWKLHDNTVQVVTLAELKEALALAMQKIGEIKVS